LSLFLNAMRASLPVMFGYVPLGIAFGILFQDLGYPWYFASLMGIFVFAGAAQFMAVGLLAAHAGLLEIAISTLALNSRHIFFGLSLLNRYPKRGLKRLYLIFGLTDETFSLVTSTRPPETGKEDDHYLAITALNQSYWVLGCSLGALAGSTFDLNTNGMEFVLTAHFVVLLIEQWKQVREPFPFAAATLCGLLALSLFEQQMLLVSICLSITLLLMYRQYRETK